jgi:hypothetical protein
MTYRGIVKDGVVIFKKKPPLKNGTLVRVAPLARREPKLRRKPAKFHPVKPWAGAPGELEALLSSVQKMREVDLSLERDGWR